MSNRSRNILIISPVGTKFYGYFGLEFFYEAAFRSLGYHVHVVSAQEKSRIGALKSRTIGRISQLTRSGLAPDIDGEHLLPKARELKPHLTIVFRCERLKSEAIQELNRLSTLGCVNIYTDAPFAIPGNGAVKLAESLQAYSAVFSFSQSLIPVFYQLGARRVEWLPFGYDPVAIHVEAERAVREPAISVSYCGTWGPIQERWLSPLVPHGLKIYGVNWERLSSRSALKSCWQEGEGLGPDMPMAIANSKINFNLVRAEHGCAHSMKTFEIPGGGGFMLTNWTEEQARFFKDGTDCVYFNTIDEMVDKARFYLANDTARERIRQSGAAAVRPHTYENRGQAILNYFETGSLRWDTFL